MLPRQNATKGEGSPARSSALAAGAGNPHQTARCFYKLQPSGSLLPIGFPRREARDGGGHPVAQGPCAGWWSNGQCQQAPPQRCSNQRQPCSRPPVPLPAAHGKAGSGKTTELPPSAGRRRCSDGRTPCILCPQDRPLDFNTETVFACSRPQE